jgi:hypothetical protein
MEFVYQLDGHSVVLLAEVSVGKDKHTIMISYRVVVDGTTVAQPLGPFEIKASKDEADRRMIIAAKMFSALKKAKAEEDNRKGKNKEKKAVSFGVENEVQEYMASVKSKFFPTLFESTGGYLSGEPYKVAAE